MDKNTFNICVRNGLAYSSAGEKVKIKRRADFNCGKDWWKFLKSEGDLHATQAEARLAIQDRREQARVDARKANGTQVATNPEHDHFLRTWTGPLCYISESEAKAAAPRDSEIAILNYPWLKDEAGDKPSPTDPVASRETQSDESQAKEVSTSETQNPREWTDIPQPLAPRNDPVNHPAHYTSSPSGIECIQVTEWMGFLLGNAVKYIWRAGSKGNEKQDLEKAIWYIQRRIKQIEKEVRNEPE